MSDNTTISYSATNLIKEERRFHAAVAAMQGIIAIGTSWTKAYVDVAEDAVKYADALLAELDKKKEDDK